MKIKEFIKVHKTILGEAFLILSILGIGIGITWHFVCNIEQAEKDRTQKVEKFLISNHYVPHIIKFILERPEFGAGCVGMDYLFEAAATKNNQSVEVKGCCSADYNTCRIIKEIVIE